MAKRRAAIPAFLVVLCLSASLQNFFFLQGFPGALLGVNAPDYLLQSTVVAFTLTGDPSRGFAPGALTTVAYKPPLFAAAAGAMAAVAGLGLRSFNMAATIFLVLTMAAVFVIGKRLWGAWWGLAAALVTACLPMVIYQSLTHTPEAAQMALVALSIALFLSGGPVASLGAGVMAGLALLSRGTAPIYLFAPIILIAARGISEKRDESPKTRPVYRVAAYLLGVVAVAAPWYFSRLPQLAQDFSFHVGDFFQRYQVGRTETGGFFLSEVARANTLISFAAFTGLSAYAIVKKGTGAWLPAVWFLAPLCLFAVAPADINRFLVPAYPAMALGIIGGLAAITKRRVAMAVLALVLAFSLGQRIFLFRAWESGTVRHSVFLNRNLASPGTIQNYGPLEREISLLAASGSEAQPMYMGITDATFPEAPPLALLKIFWAFHAPLRKTAFLQNNVATPFDLLVFARELGTMDAVLAVTPPGAPGWPGKEQLKSLVADRGPLSRMDQRHPVGPSLKAMRNARMYFVEVGRRTVGEGFGAYDLVLMARRKLDSP